MKTLWSIAMVLVFSGNVLGMGDESHEGHATQGNAMSLYHATGTVKGIGEDRRSLRIFHDPIPELKWPAMNMRFEVADETVLRSLEVGDSVHFEFVRKEGQQIITKISQ